MSERNIPLPVWTWPLLGPYNGFTGIERIQGWQLTRWAINVGILRDAYICSVTGRVSDFPMGMHNENYYDPLGPKPICKEAHIKLHRRFKDPKPWEALVEKYWASAQDPWFVHLPMEEPNMAASLRRKGVKGGDAMMGRMVEDLGVCTPRPSGVLQTLKDFDKDGKYIQKKRVLKIV